VPVLAGGCADLGQRLPSATGCSGHLAASHRLGRLLELQCLDNLIEESRNAVRQLQLARRARRSLSGPEPAPLNQLVAIGGEEFV